MRKYQKEIIQAIVKKQNYYGDNVVIGNGDGKTAVHYYGSKIGVLNHATKTYKCDKCGFKNASTTARINAIKIAANELGYTEEK